MENLPESYSRIFHIENFPGIVKKNQDELNTIEKNLNKIEEDVLCVDGAIKSGQYITVYLECEDNVFASFNNVKANVGYCCSYSLSKYENKMSILHFTINRDKYYDGIIKCKDELYFHTGCRTFNAKPIFSEPNLNSDKHKMDRFLHEDRFTVASCIGPVTYTPSPVIVLKRVEYTADDGSIEVKMELVATGTLTSVDPNRIMLKKVILTGAPLRCKKKSAVIKHMVHDPLDVTYYKPAELVTKLGLRGVIRESVGTHGIFKATFDNIIKQNDTVMLIMHKRCFPKLPEGGIVIR
jgi:pre-rRNA-processing protein TSR1